MKRVFNLLVVDESGSMSIIERQALVGINETLTTIQKMQKTHKDMEQRVTLITFDSTHKNLFYDNVSAHHIKPLKSRDYNPCGGTPLYDAIGMGIAKINALTTEDDSVLVTIITDGEENCSEEYNLKMRLEPRRCLPEKTEPASATTSAVRWIARWKRVVTLRRNKERTIS